MVIREAWNLKLDAEQVKKDKKKVVKNLKKIWKFHNWIVKEKFCSFFLKRSLAHTHTKKRNKFQIADTKSSGGEKEEEKEEQQQKQRRRFWHQAPRTAGRRGK